MNEMNGCPKSEVLAGWLEGGLGPTERAAVRRHLADCDDCRRAVALAGTLGPVPAGGARSEGEARLAERAAREARRGRFRRAGTLVAAAAAAGVAVGLAIRRGRETPPPTLPPGPTAPVAAEDSPVPPAAPPPRIVIRPSQVSVSPVEGPPARPEPPPPAAPPPREERAAPAPPAPGPARPPAAPPPAADPRPGPTIVRVPEAHAPVVVADVVSAGLRIVRGESEPTAPESAERVDGRDVLAALGPGAGFSVDGRATLALGTGTRASVFRLEAERSHGLRLTEGAALVDTEGATQRWKVSRGRTELTFAALNGRIALECRGAEDLAVTLLEGQGELREAGPGLRIASGREWWCDGAGRWTERPADPRKWKALAALLPRQVTLFVATFEEPRAAGAFSYAVVSGRVVREGDQGYVSAAPDGETGPTLRVAIRPEPAIPYVTGLRFRIRCRADAPEVIIHLGAFRAVVPLPRRGVWVEVEAALDDFLHEGVRMVPSDVVTDLRVSLPKEGREGMLDVDAVSFFRRRR